VGSNSLSIFEIIKNYSKHLQLILGMATSHFLFADVCFPKSSHEKKELTLIPTTVLSQMKVCCNNYITDYKSNCYLVEILNKHSLT